MDYESCLSPRRVIQRYEARSPLPIRRSPSPRPRFRHTYVTVTNDSMTVVPSTTTSYTFPKREMDRHGFKASPDFSARPRRNTMPPNPNPPYLSPSPINRIRSRSYYNPRSPTRRRSPSCTRDPENPDSWDHYSLQNSARKMSLPVSEPLSPSEEQQSYNILIIGQENVGKWSLMRHLVGSETDTSGNNITNCDYSKTYRRVSFHLNNSSVEITFQCQKDIDAINRMICEDKLQMKKTFDVILVVYSITDRRSFEFSAQLLTMIVFNYKNVYQDVKLCLVANKSDLVRAREVNTDDGRSLAERFEVDFVEISVELEANFDEIVIWLTTCIKEKLHIDLKSSMPMISGTSKSPPINCKKAASKKSGTLSAKAFSFVRRILQKQDMKARSCDNLYLL